MVLNKEYWLKAIFTNCKVKLTWGWTTVKMFGTTNLSQHHLKCTVVWSWQLQRNQKQSQWSTQPASVIFHCWLRILQFCQEKYSMCISSGGVQNTKCWNWFWNIWVHLMQVTQVRSYERGMITIFTMWFRDILLINTVKDKVISTYFTEHPFILEDRLYYVWGGCIAWYIFNISSTSQSQLKNSQQGEWLRTPEL